MGFVSLLAAASAFVAGVAVPPDSARVADGWATIVDCDAVRVDLTDPSVVPRIPFGNIDHVGHAFCDGAEGWGLFEHASIGAHAPTGFTDLMSVAP